MTFATLGRALGALVLMAESRALAQPVATPDPEGPTPATVPTPSSKPATEPAPNGAKAPAAEGSASKKDDGFPDLSAFLDEKYGFLPIAMPITEPAVGYGAMGGLAFLSKSLGSAAQGLGRPNITFVGGLGTANGSWGALAADSRYWLDDHLQTLTGFIYASVNLDFHGIGQDSRFHDNPLRYNLEPKGGLFIPKYRFGESRFWAGLGYAFASTKVSFDAPETTPGIPDYDRVSNMGMLLPSVNLDTRDNVFTPI